EKIDSLNHQVKVLKETAERLEKKNQEAKVKGDIQRQRELRYHTILGEQLKNQCETFVTPSKEE
uniref:MADS-box protein n=1 Tax=Mesocestoides corti TaxID=53468 RepID=A0A5K3FPD5_MESCO